MSQYTDPSQHLFWLASRAFGIVAIILLAASVSIGLMMSARVVKAPGLTPRLRNLHEALALSAVAAIAAHGLTLLGDNFLHPRLVGIALPFALADQPIWTGLGIIGGWLTAVFTFSFYARKWIGTKTWRWLHRWTIAAYALALVHTIGSGSDSHSAWMDLLLALITAPIVFGLSLRVLPQRRPARKSRARRPRTEVPPTRRRPALDTAP